MKPVTSVVSVTLELEDSGYNPRRNIEVDFLRMRSGDLHFRRREPFHWSIFCYNMSLFHLGAKDGRVMEVAYARWISDILTEEILCP